MAFRHDPANSLADIVENAGRLEDYIANMDQAAFERSGVVRDKIEGGVIWNAARYDVPGLAADTRKALARLEQESQRPEP